MQKLKDLFSVATAHKLKLDADVILICTPSVLNHEICFISKKYFFTICHV